MIRQLKGIALFVCSVAVSPIRAGLPMEMQPLGVRDGALIDAPWQMGFLHHRDGRLMAFAGDWPVRYSSDGGRTWSPPQGLTVAYKGGSVSSVIRLKSGAIGLMATSFHHWIPPATAGHHPTVAYSWYLSRDEGQTWLKPVRMNPTGEISINLFDTAIQMRSGRIIAPVYRYFYGHRGLYQDAGSFGMLKGKRFKAGGTHSFWPEITVGFVYYSDDEGQTWLRCEGDLLL